MANSRSSDSPAFGLLPDPLHGFAFARDWTAGEEAARRFLPGLNSPEELRQAVARRDSQPVPPLTAEEIAEIEQFNQQSGNPAGARLARRLADPRALAVVTGQQPNLLASPLYILLKALSAVALARRISHSLEGEPRPVVPIFWAASDDHDFQELRDCRLADPEGRLRNLGELVSRGGAPEGSPAFEWNLDEKSVDALIRAADETLSASPSHTPARELIRTALSGTPLTFETAFCRTLAALLGEEQPMVFIAPRMLWMRRRQRGILRADFERPREAARLLEESGARMAAAGYPPRLTRDRDLLNSFYLHERVRLRLVFRGAEVIAQNPVTRETVRRFTSAQLQHELDSAPERFSPNVVTRPMVQDSLLPTVAYVGGPGELSYLAQLAPVYDSFNLPRAAVTLRAGATLIPPAAARELEKLGVQPVVQPPSASDSTPPLDRLLSERLLALAPSTAPLLAGAEELETEMEARLKALWSAADLAKRPHLHPSLQKTAHSITQAVERLRTRVWRQIAQEGGETWQRYARAIALLQLPGPPQERTLAPHCFLTDRPEQLADELMARIDFNDPTPQVVYLSGI